MHCSVDALKTQPKLSCYFQQSPLLSKDLLIFNSRYHSTQKFSTFLLPKTPWNHVFISIRLLQISPQDPRCFHRPWKICRVPIKNNKGLWTKQIQAKFPISLLSVYTNLAGHTSSSSFNFDISTWKNNTYLVKQLWPLNIVMIWLKYPMYALTHGRHSINFNH